MLLAASTPKKVRVSDTTKCATKYCSRTALKRDLETIYDFIAENDTQANANYVLDKLMEVAASLAAYPERGAYPKELLALGIREYREVFFKPYRIIYRVIGKVVHVMLIADGRRDIQSLLQRRLLDLTATSDVANTGTGLNVVAPPRILQIQP